MAIDLTKDLLFIILQFLYEQKFSETAHKFEKESGVYFNMRYFEEIIRRGEWDEAEKYLSGFTKYTDNNYSRKVFFEISKQKYLEALDRKESGKAVEILSKELKVLADNECLYNEMTLLLPMDDFRENEVLSNYGDTNSAREELLKVLKKSIEMNPLFSEKIYFPAISNSRLKTLINQSAHWQHHLCKNPEPKPYFQTLYVDHSCRGRVCRSPSFHPRAANAPSHQTPTPSRGRGSVSPASHPSTSVAERSNHFHDTSDPSAMLKRHIMTLTNNPAMGYPAAESERELKRQRASGTSVDASSMAGTVVPGSHGRQSHTLEYSPGLSDDLPNKVIMTLNMYSAVQSMDFHPVQKFLLLVGTHTGKIAIRNIATRKSLALRNFRVWDVAACSPVLQVSLAAEDTASVNCVKWSPDGEFCGAAFSKHIVHVYSYSFLGNALRNHLEIDAHEGSVNDIAFAYPNKNLSLVTCGDDKVIKVWDAYTGKKLFSFEGHEAPVYSVCPRQVESVQFLYSTATDGKIKAWLYDNLGSRYDYDAPGLSTTRMACSDDGSRLFSCGTNKEGESHLVEWNEAEGVVKRVYLGLGKQSFGTVQFDTTRNQFLAAGDESIIKFWDMDGVDLLTTTDADGGLPASPCLKFSKEGMLLAVSTNDNRIKILANGNGRLLLATENRTVDPSAAASAAAAAANAQTPNVGNYRVGASSGKCIVPAVTTENMINDNRGVEGIPRLTDELGDKSRVWKATLVNEPSECRSLRLPDNVSQVKIASMLYTHSGGAILALACNGVHKLWKWLGNEANVNGKATASVVPQLIHPPSGIPMINVISEINQGEAISCFALSNNDSYVMSVSGGRISLFNLPKFKTMIKFMPPPPATTFLAFDPVDNNIIAIGKDDSSILIYNMRVTEVIAKLDGHHKRITGLAFSPTLKVLVSAAVDSQLCVWSSDGWTKLKSEHLPKPSGRVASPLANTRVQFHSDQVHVLVVHETHIAIYNAEKREFLKTLSIRESRGFITHATYSCDSQLIYMSCQDGSVGVLSSSTLILRCRVNPSSYLHANPTNPIPYPVVIAAHPSEPNQFALGLIDGGVVVLEPNGSEGQWGTAPPENVGRRCRSCSPSTVRLGSSDSHQQPSNC